MCLWLLTACLGLLPANRSPIVIVPGVPEPIIVTIQPEPSVITAIPTMPYTLPPTVPPSTPDGPPTTVLPPQTVTTPSTPSLTTTLLPTIGTFSIVPRLGTTPAPSVVLNISPTMDYSAEVPSNEIEIQENVNDEQAVNATGHLDNVALTDDDEQTANETSLLDDVRLTNEHDPAVNETGLVNNVRLTNNEPAVNVTDLLDNVQLTDDGEHNIIKRQSCACVPAGTCNRTPGGGLIDVRIVTPVQCPAGQEYCCGNINVTPQIACGTLQNVPSTGVPSSPDQAGLGEFPWQGLLLTYDTDETKNFISGCVLIDALNVITVAHRLVPFVVSGALNGRLRMGEWDYFESDQPLPYQEFATTKVFVHPMYNLVTLQYDIAVVRLASPVPFTPSVGASVIVNRACLPASPASVYTGQRCMVAGWGKNEFVQGPDYPLILKKVDLPIVAPATCQSQLQAARLGPSYVLDTTSFICAGGEADKDACTDDGGSGLVCQVNGQWVVVGLVAWGLGCGSPNVPGVYVNVAALLPWIQQQVAMP